MTPQDPAEGGPEDTDQTMTKGTRREWLAVMSGGLMMPMVQGREQAASASAEQAAGGLRLEDFQPKSALHVPEHRVEQPKFPVIDFHTHLTWSGRTSDGREDAEAVTTIVPATELLPTMDRKAVTVMVNLTGGRGAGLAQTVGRFDTAHKGRFLTFTEPWWSRANDADYPAFQAAEIERAHRAGARGVKVLKTLGLYLRTPDHRLVAVDDPRFDPMWETCAALKLPVAIHIADPEAFFAPIDRFNERYEELSHHPDWSFHGRDFPSFGELMAARDRLFARHPRTNWVALHVGHQAEDLAAVGQMLDRFPQATVDLGARIGELGRQPRAARTFFDRYQDRIIFGTDAVPNGHQTPQQLFGELLYEIYYRFLETEDEYFDYAPAPVPPQGRWRIYGLGLPDAILKKVYHDNAARLLGLDPL
jgi:predicted TIM-barrel fold metal-dependent hydrolase